jgi:hypothetical protein
MDKCNNVKQECGLELARPYVNRQIYNKAYDSETALRRGTLFPELYLIESNNYNTWLYENPMNRVNQRGVCK